MRSVLVAAFIVFTLSSTLATAQAQAQTTPGSTAPPPSNYPPATAQTQYRVFEGATPYPKGLSVFGILPWGGYGIGARFMMPLAIQPILMSPSVRDSWALEFGADYLSLGVDVPGYSFRYSEFLPVVGIMWDFWFSQQFAIYPKAELGYAFAWWSDTFSGPGIGGYGGVFISGAAGALYRLNNGLTLRAEAGISGLKVGLGWLF